MSRFQLLDKIPIVYCKEYNVTFCGLQCLHPYDAERGQHILELLLTAEICDEKHIARPLEITDQQLLEIHTEDYLNSLKISDQVGKIAEIPLLHFVPNIFVQDAYLKPMRFQVGGSLLAAKLALRYGWAINLGGGFHHCSSDQSGSFSPFADISLVVQYLLDESKKVSSVLIVDLAARQGNGFERDLMDKKNVYIFDMFNSTIYPGDEFAKVAITRRVELPSRTSDEVYLRKLRINLAAVLKEFRPDAIVYNAGTDVLDGDSLGELSISPEGIIQRDEYVFSKAYAYKIPIVMLLGTGFTKNVSEIISTSILNLKEKGYLPSKLWSK